MALTQSERIQISKKIISIEAENALADSIINQLDESKAKVESKDNAHKKFSDGFTSLIDGYQNELEKYDGNERSNLIEQDFIDSAERKLQNPFFPNDSSTPTASLPEGTWSNFIPFALNKAIGKAYNEGWVSTVTKEQDLIDNINTQIAIIEGLSNITRSTGQHCVSTPTGVCSNPLYTDQISCEDNGGTWTPGSPLESIEDEPTMQDAATALKDAVQSWEDFLNVLDSLIVTTDTNPSRSSENISSKNDISNTKSIIDNWQSLLDFDTTHGQTTCAGFNSYDYTTLDDTKFRDTELQLLKDEIVARQAFISIRISQLELYLGAIDQNLSDGSINSSSGLYGQRFGFIDLRINALMGSLTEVKGFDQGQDAQNSMKDANDNALVTYNSVMKVSLFRAPGAGTGTIHVINATDFSNGDSVYIVGDDLEEINCSIINIDNNTVYLDTNISPKYTRNINSRIYKLL